MGKQKESEREIREISEKYLISYFNLCFRLNPHGRVQFEYSNRIGVAQASYKDWSFYPHIRGVRWYPKLYTITLIALPDYRFSIKRVSERSIVIIGKGNQWALELNQSRGYQLVSKTV